MDAPVEISCYFVSLRENALDIKETLKSGSYSINDSDCVALRSIGENRWCRIHLMTQNNPDSNDTRQKYIAIECGQIDGNSILNISSLINKYEENCTFIVLGYKNKDINYEDFDKFITENKLSFFDVHANGYSGKYSHALIEHIIKLISTNNTAHEKNERSNDACCFNFVLNVLINVANVLSLFIPYLIICWVNNKNYYKENKDDRGSYFKFFGRENGSRERVDSLSKVNSDEDVDQEEFRL